MLQSVFEVGRAWRCASVRPLSKRRPNLALPTKAVFTTLPALCLARLTTCTYRPVHARLHTGEREDSLHPMAKCAGGIPRLHLRRDHFLGSTNTPRRGRFPLRTIRPSAPSIHSLRAERPTMARFLGSLIRRPGRPASARNRRSMSWPYRFIRASSAACRVRRGPGLHARRDQRSKRVYFRRRGTTFRSASSAVSRCSRE